MKPYWKNFKASFFHPFGEDGHARPEKGRRADWIDSAEMFCGSLLVPAVVGVGVGMLLASAGMGIILAGVVGVGAAMASLPLVLAGAAFANLTRHSYLSKLVAFMPGLIGMALGRTLAWAAYSVLHPRETLRELSQEEKTAEPVVLSPRVRTPCPDALAKKIALRKSFADAQSGSRLKTNDAQVVRQSTMKA